MYCVSAVAGFLALLMCYRYISFTILHSEVTMTAELGLLYCYIMCDDAVTQSSSAEMNRVLTAQRQTNKSHGEDATLLVIYFSICCDRLPSCFTYLLFF